MAERKRKKKREEEVIEPTKQENEIGKYMRWNCPCKHSTMMNQKVDYFIGSKAVDTLLESKWATGKGGTEILFTDRESATAFLDRLLFLGFFSRVNRIKKKKKGEDKEKDVKEKDVKEKEETEGKKSKKKKDRKEKEDGEGDGNEGKKKVKVKVKLEMSDNLEQFFVDGDEAYIWIFDPVHPRTFVMGILVVIATIAICMFPLWPESVQGYVWYVSVAAAFAVGMILFLALFRYVLFGLIWVTSMGKHHFWLLPNLTEDCGFLESFVPVYSYKCYNGEDEVAKQKKDDDYRPDSVEPEEDNEGDEEENDQKDRTDITVCNDKEPETPEKEPWIEVTPEDAETARQEAEQAIEQVEQQNTDTKDEGKSSEAAF